MSRKTPIPAAQLAEERRRRAAGRSKTGQREYYVRVHSAEINVHCQRALERRGLIDHNFTYGFR